MPSGAKNAAFPRNLVLIGGRGSGKSSIARRLLREERRFSLFSLDAMIRYEAGGLTIPELVERRGWYGFRDLEHEVVCKVSAIPGGALIDCGGGVVVDLDAEGTEVFSERKVESLRAYGVVVDLRCPISYLERKIAGDTERPSLSTTKSFRRVMERREQFYQRAADHVIECRRRPKSVLVEELLEYFEEVL